MEKKYYIFIAFCQVKCLKWKMKALKSILGFIMQANGTFKFMEKSTARKRDGWSWFHFCADFHYRQWIYYLFFPSFFTVVNWWKLYKCLILSSSYIHFPIYSEIMEKTFSICCGLIWRYLILQPISIRHISFLHWFQFPLYSLRQRMTLKECWFHL